MKTTDELRSEIIHAAGPNLLTQNDFEPKAFSHYLAQLLEEKGLAVKDAIRKLYLERSYGYQLFNGTRKPTRLFLLRLALVLGLDETEANRLLAQGGKSALYPRVRADAAVLYALSHKLTLEEGDELLTSLGEGGLL